MAAARQQSLPTSIPGARQRHQPGLQCSSGTSCRQSRRFSFDAGAVVFPFTDKRFRSEVSGGATDVGSRYREFEDILFFRPQDIRSLGSSILTCCITEAPQADCPLPDSPLADTCCISKAPRRRREASVLTRTGEPKALSFSLFRLWSGRRVGCCHCQRCF